MARGWESKDVESQMEAAAERKVQAELNAEVLELRARRNSLLLDRKRVLADLETTNHPRRRDLLQKALDHLDAKLAALEEQD